MPATVTLSTTTLSLPVGASDTQLLLASTSGIAPKTRLYLGRELCEVIALGVGNWVRVVRGSDATPGLIHNSGETVYVGRADQFYRLDPVGRPPGAIPVSPWINVTTGDIWFAQGDAEPESAERWWGKQTVTRGVGALGVRTTVLDPETST